MSAKKQKQMTIEQWILSRPKTGFVEGSSGLLHSVHIVYENNRSGTAVANAHYRSECSGRPVIGHFYKTMPENAKTCRKCAEIMEAQAKPKETK